ncbi:hypothetical protein [Paenibacillus arenilitoris]|uniref:DUF5709 domain-containing protein n=1 Tax=Paenibacillus arenilitoris TaxID=2772299 RepID=A0A927CHL3_9BACL|nr:hypothetical protein [Paenibacillus arenilitoris]MBD2868244.1 hypothetical protein [Paenibacillus arenilitoris]
MANDHGRDARKPESLATERDIDPEFGLFTEEAGEGAVPDAEELLTAQQRRPDARVHEGHVPEALEAGTGQGDEVDTPEEISEELASVPDADAVARNSPVDPASPGDEFHGTDLLNGVGNHPEEETEEP